SCFLGAAGPRAAAAPPTAGGNPPTPWSVRGAAPRQNAGLAVRGSVATARRLDADNSTRTHRAATDDQLHRSTPRRHRLRARPGEPVVPTARKSLTCRLRDSSKTASVAREN